MPEAPTERVRVLVVDDTGPLRAYITRHLETANYEVSEAPSAREALALIAAGECPFDLLLVDVGTPGLERFDQARRLLGACPRARVLCTTDYASAVDAVARLIVPAPACLLKPFGSEELIRAVARVLAGGG